MKTILTESSDHSISDVLGSKAFSEDDLGSSHSPYGLIKTGPGATSMSGSSPSSVPSVPSDDARDAEVTSPQPKVSPATGGPGAEQAESTKLTDGTAADSKGFSWTKEAEAAAKEAVDFVKEKYNAIVDEVKSRTDATIKSYENFLPSLWQAKGIKSDGIAPNPLSTLINSSNCFDETNMEALCAVNALGEAIRDAFAIMAGPHEEAKRSKNEVRLIETELRVHELTMVADRECRSALSCLVYALRAISRLADVDNSEKEIKRTVGHLERYAGYAKEYLDKIDVQLKSLQDIAETSSQSEQVRLSAKTAIGIINKEKDFVVKACILVLTEANSLAEKYKTCR